MIADYHQHCIIIDLGYETFYENLDLVELFIHTLVFSRAIGVAYVIESQHMPYY
jgi:hypothetical protein